MDLDMNFIRIWSLRLVRHYVCRFETVLAFLMFGAIWIYLRWMDNRLKVKISLSAADLNRGLSSELRNWIESGFLSVHLDGETQSWQLQRDNVAVYAVRGLRSTMEDRFNILLEKNRWKLSIYGIFDGHGGAFAADFTEGTLFKSIIHRINAESKFKSTIDVEKILFEEIISVDHKLTNITEQRNDITGTTALVAVIYNNVLTVANVGDSRGVLCVDIDKVLPVSVDHKPNHSKERQRINDAGGWVAFNGVWRVAGILATSRALGDYFLKRPGFVIPDPDILNFDLQTINARFLLLATDGLWDVFTNEEVVKYISEHLSEPLFGAKSLVELALSRGSTDNVSVMIVMLDQNKDAANVAV